MARDDMERRDGPGDDRGDAGGTALVWGLAVSMLLGLLWIGIQVAFDHYAQSMAEAAAQAGVRAAASYPADLSRAEPAVLAFIAEQAPHDVQNPQVKVTAGADGRSVTVTVTGNAVSVIPATTWSVTGAASGPLEQ